MWPTNPPRGTIAKPRLPLNVQPDILLILERGDALVTPVPLDTATTV